MKDHVLANFRVTIGENILTILLITQDPLSKCLGFRVKERLFVLRVEGPVRAKNNYIGVWVDV